MTVVRTHRYTVLTGKLAQLLERRTLLIRGIRSVHPEFTTATLIRQDDGSYLDIWRWESAEALRGTTRGVPTFPLAAATASLTADHTVSDGTLLDER